MIAGRYSLDREIGRGGMGAVWLGRDEVLGRQVALKRLGAPTGDGVGLARAEREAQLTARLSHPHVVAVFNLAVDADTGVHWLVMEYVEGNTLAELVRDEGPLSPDAAAPLLRQAADGLVSAHAAGIVHRDVKPSNILVDTSRQVKLTDFGIARAAADPSLTQTGLVTGSPAYLAPEVAAGQRADEAADVWSLGATIFHVLSGRPPYEIGDHVLSGLYRIVNEEPPRLADAGWMAPLLEATMVKDPTRRWTMAQVRDFLAAGPTRRLPPASAPVRSRRPGPALLAGLIGGGLGLVLVLGVVFLDDRAPTDTAAGDSSASPTEQTSSQSPTADRRSEAPGPTVRGMESFIRGYVAAVTTDPATAWEMLTPEFQRESGGLATYREFWSGVGEGRILGIRANPRTLVVRYRVDFTNFGTGRRPTVLELVFDDGRYLIDGERTEGVGE